MMNVASTERLSRDKDGWGCYTRIYEGLLFAKSWGHKRAWQPQLWRSDCVTGELANVCARNLSRRGNDREKWRNTISEAKTRPCFFLIYFVGRASCCDSWQMTNLTHNSFLCIYFNSLHVSNNPLLIIRRINCINTISGIYHCLWHIPDVVLIQLILLMMSKRLLDTCRELK